MTPIPPAPKDMITDAPMQIVMDERIYQLLRLLVTTHIWIALILICILFIGLWKK